MTEPWGTGLCSCFMDTNQCIDAWCCYPCTVSRQLTSLETTQPDSFSVGKCICPGLCHPAISSCYVRKQVVDKYKIDENIIMTLCKGMCVLCSITQTHRELTRRNLWPGGSCLHKQPGSYEMA